MEESLYPSEYSTTGKLEKLSYHEKIADDHAWYKRKAKWVTLVSKNLDVNHMKINYDLANNILNEDDFKYVVNPFNNPEFKLPARLDNKDIISNKLKVLEGMEMKRPFVWKIVAVNPEATTRKEQEEASRIRDFVVQSIMNPITQSIQKQYETELQQIQAQGGNSPEVQQKLEMIKSQIDSQVKAQTPTEVKKYMERDHQDPLEVMSQQILSYLLLDKDAKRKFNKGWRHAVRAGMEVYYVGEKNGEPDFKPLNPLRFKFFKNEETDFFEDGEACYYQYDMTFNELVTFFGDELDDDEIKILQRNLYNYSVNVPTIDWDKPDDLSRTIGMTVNHCVWKSLREIKILKYYDEEGQEKETLVDESYQLNKDAGDIEIESKWLPEVYETWILPNKIYKRMRPVPGQFRDINKLYSCKLPYYGGIYDDMNSRITSLIDRMKTWQYYYNIIYYKIELLMASDKGKKMLMNINAIPTDAGIDVEKWQHFFESTPYVFYNPSEEGMEGGFGDANTLAKILDFSMVNQLNQYIELADKVKFECGEAVGINRQVEGQVQSNDAVYNTKQAIMQTSTLLEPFFSFHDNVKRNVLTGLMECAKVVYENQEGKKLSYVLDDESLVTFSINGQLLQNASYGLYVQNSLKIEEIKDSLTQLAHAALQNQQIKLSTFVSILKEESLTEAEETLKVGEKEMQEELQEAQKSQQQHEKEMQEAILQQQRENFENQKELVVLKETERRETEFGKTALMGASFNPDEDKNENGVNDFVELAQKFAKIKNDEAKLNLDKQKFEHDKKMDGIKANQENKKIAIQNKKKSQ